MYVLRGALVFKRFAVCSVAKLVSVSVTLILVFSSIYLLSVTEVHAQAAQGASNLSPPVLSAGRQKYEAYALKKKRKNKMPSFKQMARAKHTRDFVLVKFKNPNTNVNVLKHLGVRHDRRLSVVEGLRRLRVTKRVLRTHTIEQLLEQLNAHPLVDYAEPDYIIETTATPNDTLTGGSSAWWLNQINAYEAWNYGTDATSIGPVSVFDTGIDTNHPDLRDNLWVNSGEIANNNIDDDGNGYVDDIHGVTILAGNRIHGTSVAGTICAQGNNGFGVVGSAWDCELMDVQSVGSFDDTASAVVLGLEYALDKGSRLSNHSWRLYIFSQVLADAIDAAEQAGHLLVVAAGNEGRDIEITPCYPCSLPNDNIITVAASTLNESRISYSSFGNVSVDLAAPTEFITTSKGNGYLSFSGTSQSTPVVAGAVALLWSQVPNWNFRQVKNHLLSNVRPSAYWTGLTTTGGILDMGAMMRNLVLDPKFTVENKRVSESTGTAQITVSIGVASDQPLSVRVSTDNDSALSGRDYVAASRTLVFAPGEVNKTFSVVITDDARVEDTESFYVRLSDATGAPIAKSQATVDITDNDFFAGTTLIESLSNHEIYNSSYSIGYSFKVNRTMLIAQLGAIDINNNNVLDGPVQLGLWNAAGTLLRSITVSSNTAIDGQTFWAQLNSPVELVAGNDYIIAGTFGGSAEPWGYRGTITKEPVFVPDKGKYRSSSSLIYPSSTDVNGIYHGPNLREQGEQGTSSLFSVSPVEVREDGSTVAVEVSLSAAINRPATVSYAMTNGSAQSGSDYTGFSGEFTFAPGETVKTITIPIIDDIVVEATESFTVSLSDPAGGEIGVSSAKVTIIDDDNSLVQLSIADTSVTEGKYAKLRLSLSQASSLDVRFNFSTANGTAIGNSDYSVKDGSRVIPAGEVEKFIWIATTDDILPESDETFSVELSTAVNAQIANGSGRVTIVDNDQTVLPVLSVTDAVVAEGRYARVTISLSQPSQQEVSFNISTLDETATAGSDYMSKDGNRVIAAGDTEKLIWIETTEDLRVEADETFRLQISDAIHANIADDSGQIIITDNDNAVSLPKLNVIDASVTEGKYARVTVRLSRPSTQDISFNVLTVNETATSGDDYTSKNGKRVLEAGEMEMILWVLTSDDQFSETDETFRLNVSDAVNADIVDANGRITIIDND